MTEMRAYIDLIRTLYESVRSPEDIDANAKVDLGVLYRGVEAGPNAQQALRHFKGGDLGDGIYLTAEQGLAASYGGGPKASVKAGTRVVHAYRVAPLFPEDVVYLFGGRRADEPVRLVSGTGIELWHGPWKSAAIETALRHHPGIRVVVGTPDSVAVNQIAVRDPSVLSPMEESTNEARRYTLGDYERILSQQRELEGLRAAMRDPKTGKVYVGSSHKAAIDTVPQSDDTGIWGRLSDEWYNSTENSGFVDTRTGQFISRDEAARRWDVLTIEDVRDKLRAARGQR